MFEDRIVESPKTFKESSNIRTPGSLSSPMPLRRREFSFRH